MSGNTNHLLGTSKSSDLLALAAESEGAHEILPLGVDAAAALLAESQEGSLLVQGCDRELRPGFRTLRVRCAHLPLPECRSVAQHFQKTRAQPNMIKDSRAITRADKLRMRASNECKHEF